jgi:hypothetical protein
VDFWCAHTVSQFPAQAQRSAAGIVSIAFRIGVNCRYFSGMLPPPDARPLNRLVTPGKLVCYAVP